MKDPVFAVGPLKVKEFNHPVRVVTLQWTESVEDGDRLVERAVATPEQFDAAVTEYVAAINSAYRPEDSL